MFGYFVFFALVVAFVVPPVFAQAYKVPRTPWGDPDLQGIWPGTEFATVPLERPAQLGTRNLLNDDEMVARALRERNRREGVERDGAGGPTGSPGHWVEWGTTQRQASLLIDPPDGRMPAMTAAATARASKQPEGTSGKGPLNSPLDFTMWERCISRGVLGSTLPALYGSGIDITQGPGVVAIRYEMIHEHRVIPIRPPAPSGVEGRPPVDVEPSGVEGPAPSGVEGRLLSAAIQQYMGDPRGHWEGDTLVVETRNFNGRTGPAVGGGGVPNTPGMVLTERFRRVSGDTIQYEATVRDPGTWVAPWTVSFPLRLTPEYGMHEYACHEGNYSLRNALSAARAAER